jgi:mRNA interferase MazF
MNQQDIVLVHYPYTSFEQTKLRPAVILSNNTFNDEHAFCILCPINSKESLSKYVLEILPKKIEGELKTKSYIRTDNIMSIEKELILDSIGKITLPFFEQIRKNVGQNFA